MNKFYLLFLLVLLCCKSLFALEYLPISKGSIVKHTFYTLAYSEPNEQAEWVYYKLTNEMVLGEERRTEDFRPDPSVKTGSAELSDYKGSGYDRGHLCPAGDMRFLQNAMSETFFLSNMSPQVPAFNRGTWKNLESLVRQWATTYDSIYVVTGPIFRNNNGTIGSNKVTIPGYYYKVVYCPNKEMMIAFVLPNCKASNELSSYSVSADSVEHLTGIDFFPQLPDDLENRLECKIEISGWSFIVNKTSKSTYTSSEAKDKAIQCNGIAKSTGQQCKNMTINENGYCYAHVSQAPDYVQPQSDNYVGRCNAITKKGTQCKRNASNGTKYCWQHQK
jgi:endonuclease G